MKKTKLDKRLLLEQIAVCASIAIKKMNDADYSEMKLNETSEFETIEQQIWENRRHKALTEYHDALDNIECFIKELQGD